MMEEDDGESVSMSDPAHTIPVSQPQVPGRWNMRDKKDSTNREALK